MSRRITLPQVLALMAIWTAVIYGLTAARPSAEVAQISLKKPTVVACARPNEGPDKGWAPAASLAAGAQVRPLGRGGVEGRTQY
jgi:hypothetical protein